MFRRRAKNTQVWNSEETEGRGYIFENPQHICKVVAMGWVEITRQKAHNEGKGREK